MKYISLYCLLFIAIFISSCTKQTTAPPTPMTPTDLYNMYNSGIVLIKHEYFYRADFDNGLSFCYAGNGDDFHVYINMEDAMTNPTTSYATGFFIDSLGTIATNMHVISPPHDALGWDKLNRELYIYREYYEERLSDLKLSEFKALDLLNNHSLNYEQRNTVHQIYQEVKDSISLCQKIVNITSFNPQNTHLTLMTTSIAVAYNNSHITSSKGYDECIFITKRLDSNTDYDIGLIQLESKRIPSHASLLPIHAYSQDSLPINSEVYMIGYNYGYELAQTTNGIKSQLTQGYISQEPDMNRVLYSIPALQGSSGSPVLNKWGRVVAINYAGLKGAQGFNFGVPVRHLEQLYKEFQPKTQGN